MRGFDVKMSSSGWRGILYLVPIQHNLPTAKTILAVCLQLKTGHSMRWKSVFQNEFGPIPAFCVFPWNQCEMVVDGRPGLSGLKGLFPCYIVTLN